MATDERVFASQRDGSAVLQAAAAGVLAGLGFGVLIQFGLERMGAIGAIYTLGTPNVSVGWVAHVVHSALFGALFGLVVDRPAFDALTARVSTSAGLGAAYAAGLWLANIVVAWPLLLSAVGLPGAPAVPFVSLPALAGHLIYGTVTGGVYAVVRRR